MICQLGAGLSVAPAQFSFLTNDAEQGSPRQSQAVLFASPEGERNGRRGKGERGKDGRGKGERGGREASCKYGKCCKVVSEPS